MKIIFSPSKSQKPQELTAPISSEAVFVEQAGYLLDVLRSIPDEELKNIYKISDSLLTQSLEEITLGFKAKTYPALCLFSGTAFQELKNTQYTQSMQDYAQEHLCILSALYGVLRPYDGAIKHRLDMTNNIFKEEKDLTNLYDYWSQYVRDYFDEEDCVINLASGEYSKMLQGVPVRLITIHFLQNNENVEKSVAVYSKQQRGKMLNWLIVNEVGSAEVLKNTLQIIIFSIKKSPPRLIIFL